MKAYIRPIVQEKTDQIREVIKEEVRKQYLETQERFCNDLDAVVLWVLHEKFGFGKQRLKAFYDCFKDVYGELVEQYELGSDTPFVAMQKLKSIGVDLDEWSKEVKEGD